MVMVMWLIHCSWPPLPGINAWGWRLAADPGLPRFVAVLRDPAAFTSGKCVQATTSATYFLMQAKSLMGVLQQTLPSQREVLCDVSSLQGLIAFLKLRATPLLALKRSILKKYNDFFSLGRSRRKRNPKALNQPNQDADPWQSEDEEHRKKQNLTRKAENALRFKDIAVRPEQAAPAMLGGAWPVTSRLPHKAIDDRRPQRRKANANVAVAGREPPGRRHGWARSK
eukprot:s3105_g3.t1